ncbi:MAG: hypothetical protein J6R22_04575 [Alphaproteobacteria bacterium]|nr:hypothetical protein [Alphaproteobacteria bacterium]
MKYIVLIVFVLLTGNAFANVASVSYVSQATQTKVDTAADTVQTLQGDYTVSGSVVVTGSFTVTGAFKVPTPPLPNPNAD